MEARDVLGIFFGTLLGSMFIVSCFISVVKAVRDRRIIKAKIEAKRAAREQIAAYRFAKKRQSNANHCVLSSIEDSEQNDSALVNNGHNDMKILVNGSDNHQQVHVPVFRTLSADEMPSTSEKNVHVNACSKQTLEKTFSYSVPDLGRDKSHLSKDCLAVRKQLRRKSYALAIDNSNGVSWLPHPSPKFANSSAIIETYRYNSLPITPAYVNKAFDSKEIVL